MNLSSQNVPQKSKVPLICAICGKPVAVETSKTDDDGKAIHEDCYVKSLKVEHAGRDGSGS
jgi:hypothetical protein